MDPYIVLIPGHAFLLWGDGNGNAEDALETKMVRYNSFDDAYQEGVNEFETEKNNGDFDINISVVVSVKYVRDHGIMSMQ